MIRVTLTEVQPGGKIWTRKHDVKTKHTALEASVLRHFGKRFNFVKDETLSSNDTLYGQIVDADGVRIHGLIRAEFLNEE